MIKYIDENRKENSNKARRKYDIFWSIISVTIISLGIGIEKSIWDSYGFKGNDALNLVFLILFIIAMALFLFIVSMAYDSVISKTSEEEKIKMALQEVLFSRSVEMLVVVKKDSHFLIEDLE